KFTTDHKIRPKESTQFTPENLKDADGLCFRLYRVLKGKVGRQPRNRYIELCAKYRNCYLARGEHLSRKWFAVESGMNETSIWRTLRNHKKAMSFNEFRQGAVADLQEP